MMGLNNKGKAGCGCLIFLLVLCMVLVALFIHPVSLKFLAGRLVFADPIVPSDALYVPRFLEDKNGEVYLDAFKEYLAGNGKAICIEDDQVLGVSIKEIVGRMAKQRGIKEDAIKKVEVGIEGEAAAAKVQEFFSRLGAKKVIILVPEYASRRFHLMFGDADSPGKVIFLVKPVPVSYFKKEKWWGNESSRAAIQREGYSLGAVLFSRFKYGAQDNQKQ
jgi:hypothetical protein